MKFSTAFKKGRLIERYKRFFVTLQHKNEVLTAHLANTGSLKGVFKPGLESFFTSTSDPKRKLKFSLQLIKHPSSLVGVNTSLANSIVFEALSLKKIPSLKTFKDLKKEVKISEKSRIDLVLSKKTFKEKLGLSFFQSLAKAERESFHFMEVKNVTLAYPSKKTAFFPDSPTERGRKHLRELIKKKEEGFSAEIFFLVQRSDCEFFSPEKTIDPEYARLLIEAHKKGVKISSYGCIFKKDEISLNLKNKLKIVL